MSTYAVTFRLAEDETCQDRSTKLTTLLRELGEFWTNGKSFSLVSSTRDSEELMREIKTRAGLNPEADVLLVIKVNAPGFLVSGPVTKDDFGGHCKSVRKSPDWTMIYLK